MVIDTKFRRRQLDIMLNRLRVNAVYDFVEQNVIVFHSHRDGEFFPTYSWVLGEDSAQECAALVNRNWRIDSQIWFNFNEL